MKRLIFLGLVTAVLVAVASTAAYAGQSELTALKASTARFHSLKIAEAAGYSLLPGLDHCFNNPGVGAMGYHYIKASSLDLELSFLHPEALVYAPDANGRLKLAAVEYIVPAAPWDAAGNTAPPELNGMSLHLNEQLGVYVLHIWIWQTNPAGMFEDWNPDVTCP
jgi:hypothetical protein